MTRPRVLRIASAALLAAIVVIWTFDRHIVRTGLDLAIQPEVRSALEQARADLRRLRDLDPDNAEEYRARFEELQTLNRRLEILGLNRDAIAKRYRLLFTAAIAVIITLLLVTVVIDGRRTERRMELLRTDLELLARGGMPTGEAKGSGDLIDRISAMIVRAGNAMHRERRRVEELRYLSAWQESMRRLVHDLRGPLTAARLEAGKVQEIVGDVPDNDAAAAARNVRQEIDRIAKLTGQIASFASLGPIDPRPTKVAEFLRDFADTFQDAWPGLRIEVSADDDLELHLDRDLLRRVLVNLTENSVTACRTDPRVRIELQRKGSTVGIAHRDNGSGIPPTVLERLFEPYVTSRRAGGGTGLGLAISKKILLDMGGDLRLASTSSEGTTFVIELPGANA